MPFSKAYRAAVFADFRAQGAYIDYKGLKDIIHRMKEDIANPATPDELYRALLDSKKSAREWLALKVAELARVAAALVEASTYLDDDMAATNANAANAAALAVAAADAPQPDLAPSLSSTAGGGGPSNVSRVFGLLALPAVNAQVAADAVLHEALRAVECRNLNSDTIHHIVSRMYRYSTLGPTGKWLTLESENDLFGVSFDEVLYLLSLVYERVKLQRERRRKRSGRGGAAADDVPAGAVGSQVFDRRSVKYWVHRQDLPFVLARLIQHLPLSTFKDVYKESQERGTVFTLGQPVSSTYYDNRRFLFYHRRLERLEGSTLIRMRWYTDTLEPDWDEIQQDASVYMEIKVHHEAWSGDRSNKRRFAVKSRDVDAYTRGQLSLEPAVEKLRAKHAPEREIDKFKALAAEILDKIHAYDLKPVLRTQCLRAAFQRGLDQSVRVSVDTQLRMSAEDFGLSHHWRYCGADTPARHHFPYAVVELKLQCAENERIAPWIEELMGCRFMEPVPKFSKYAHGIASIYGHTPYVSMVPYWLHQLEHEDLRAAMKPETKQWDPTQGLAVGCWQRSADRLVFGTGAAQTASVGASEAQFLPSGDHALVYAQLVRGVAGSGTGSGGIAATAAASSSAASGLALLSSFAGGGGGGGGGTMSQLQASRSLVRRASSVGMPRGVGPLSPLPPPTPPPAVPPSPHSGPADALAATASTLPAAAALSRSPPAATVVLPPPSAVTAAALQPTASSALAGGGAHSLERRHEAYALYHLYHRTEGGIESICIGAAAAESSRSAAAQVEAATIPWQTGKRIKVPQKYDPKTLLTSERYMIKWVERAALMGLTGIGLIHFANSHSLPLAPAAAPAIPAAADAGSSNGGGAPLVAAGGGGGGGGGGTVPLPLRAGFYVFLGTALVVLAIATSAYALMTFHARARRVYGRRKIRYDDVRGPTWLAVLLGLTMAAVAANEVALRYGPMLSGSDRF